MDGLGGVRYSKAWGPDMGESKRHETSRTLIIIFWDMSSFFWVMSVMLLTFVFAFLLSLGAKQQKAGEGSKDVRSVQ